MTDHCTAWFEGWWAACCAAHDANYLEQVGRLLADGRLLDCVSHSLPSWAASHPSLVAAVGVASTAIGAIMFIAVRLVGQSFYRRAAARNGATRPVDPVS